MLRPPPNSPFFPTPTLSRSPFLLSPLVQRRTASADTAAGRPCKVIIDSVGRQARQVEVRRGETNVFAGGGVLAHCEGTGDRKSTRLNSSHGYISYAVFCLKKKKNRDSN